MVSKHDFYINELERLIKLNVFDFLPEYELVLKKWHFRDGKGNEGELDLVGVIDSDFLGYGS